MNNTELIARAKSFIEGGDYFTGSEIRNLVYPLLDALEAAQSAGEPVAWRTFDGEGRYEFQEYDNNEGYKDAWESKNPTHKGWVEPLYTHPAPQVPMTDEEIDEAYLKHQNGPYERAFTAGLKAAEAHHKIGVKP